MTVERRQTIGELDEFRIVCDSCGEATEWTENDLDPLEVRVSCRIDVVDGKDVCAVCAGRFSVGLALGAMAAATGAKVSPEEVVEMADNIVGDERVGAGARPLSGQSVCVTGRVTAPNGRHVPRDEMIQLIGALGGHFVPKPNLADVLIRGDTGVHGETNKVREARRHGAEVRDQSDFWLGVQDDVDKNGKAAAWKQKAKARKASRPTRKAKRREPDLPSAAAVEELKGLLSSTLREFDDIDDI